MTTVYTLDLEGRAKNAPLNGFTLTQAIGEAIGAASTCWKDHPEEGRIFDSENALAVAQDLQNAIASFLQTAINQQSIDADLNMADWEAAELILQAPAMGYETTEPTA